MPDLVRTRIRPFNKAFELAFYLFDLAAYEFLYRLSPVRGQKFFNGGYLPLADDLIPVPELAGEAPNVMMYHLVARSNLAGLTCDPQTILDVGCGQAGGLLYMSHLFPGARLSGTDRNGTVMRLARKTLAAVPGTTLRKAQGNGINFPDAAFDLVLSVGAPTYFGLSEFIREAARVAAPGGVISFSAGYRQGDHAEIEAEVRKAAAESGLGVEGYWDITPHTFASLKADIPRREKLLKRVPWPFRLYGARWADMPGSPEYEEYATGKRADFAVVLTKP